MGFVDSFRRRPNLKYISESVEPYNIEERVKSLIVATIWALCKEKNLEVPRWCKSRKWQLKYPWFVAGVENLKATALQESPAYYRTFNIFVMENFLDRV